MVQLKTGAVVTLKSGGPKMTVDGQVSTARGNPAGRWHCVWFEAAERRSGEFAGEALAVATHSNEAQ